MSAPELLILENLIARLDRLQISAMDDLAWMEGLPADLSEFETMASHRQSAARAVLKSFELIEDQLSRAFRAIPKILAEDSSRWFARDFADFMEGVGVLENAGHWSKIARLRNKLVHDYPLDPQVQFDRVVEAVGYLPYLRETHRRLATFARDDLPRKLP